MYQRSVGPERESFWAEQAESLRWMRPFKKVVYEDFKTGDVRWFTGGTLNVCDNCVDRWAETARDRMEDAQSPIVVTSDQGLRGKKVIELKKICDDAMEPCSFIKTCFVFKRTGGAVNMKEGRDVWALEAAANMKPYCPPEEMASEDQLFMLYTSGSTGKPKGVFHCTAGYLLWTSMTVKNVFDLHVGDNYCSVADVGWITGHSYIVYGPLANGCSTFIFESVPTYPDPGRYWDMVQRHKITQFYTAPTAIRTLMR